MKAYGYQPGSRLDHRSIIAVRWASVIFVRPGRSRKVASTRSVIRGLATSYNIASHYLLPQGASVQPT